MVLEESKLIPVRLELVIEGSKIQRLLNIVIVLSEAVSGARLE